MSHPDDETFGCGGTLALHALNGDRASVLCLTCPSPKRRAELAHAAEALGLPKPIIFDEERLTINDDVRKRISDVIVSTRPRAVITHLPFDYHREHRIACEMVKEAVEWAAHTTTYNEPWLIKRLLLMEVNTLIPSPHVLVDISNVIESKFDAIDCYASQLSKFPWGYYREFNMKKAELRGVQAGCRYAEAFMEEPLTQNSPFYETKRTKSLI